MNLQEYTAVRVERNAKRRHDDELAAREKLPALMNVVVEAHEKLPQTFEACPTPSIQMTVIYLGHTVWGWDTRLCGVLFGKHRTQVARYVRQVEDARDDQAFDTILNEIEKEFA